MRVPLRLKLVLLNTAITGALIGALGFGVQRTAESQLLARVDSSLVSEARSLAGITCVDGSPATPEAVASGQIFCVDAGALHTRVFNADGSSLTEHKEERPLGLTPGLQTVSLPEGDHRVYTQQVADKWVQHVYPLGDFQTASQSFTRTLLLFIPVGLLLAALGGALVTGRSLNPLKQIADKANQISGENLRERLPAEQGEFGELSQTLNGMLDRIETFSEDQKVLIERQRRFISDASHELRTPLTIIKGSTSLALCGHRTEQEFKSALHRIDTAATTLVALSEDLLLLARNSSESAMLMEPVLLSELLNEAVEPYETVVLDFNGDAFISGNQPSLKRVLWNLIQNALSHSGTDLVSIKSAVSDQVEICVEDRGKGIAKEQLPYIFDRFYTGDESRSKGGLGLGLAICKEIVERHGGTISVNSSQGVGTTFTLRFPVMQRVQKEEGVKSSAGA